jgi:uncharacterized membrane protein (DUF373 family)
MFVIDFDAGLSAVPAGSLAHARCLFGVYGVVGHGVVVFFGGGVMAVGANRSGRWRVVLDVLEGAQDVLHLGVAVLLMGIAGYVFYETAHDLVSAGSDFGVRVGAAINGVLFVIIVMEILQTVTAHFDSQGFQLKPFLIIGIISAVRHILTVGAQQSLGTEGTTEAFRRTQIELGVNAAVTVTLVIGLVLIRRTEPRDGRNDG